MERASEMVLEESQSSLGPMHSNSTTPSAFRSTSWWTPHATPELPSIKPASTRRWKNSAPPHVLPGEAGVNKAQTPISANFHRRSSKDIAHPCKLTVAYLRSLKAEQTFRNSIAKMRERSFWIKLPSTQSPVAKSEM